MSSHSTFFINKSAFTVDYLDWSRQRDIILANLNRFFHRSITVGARALAGLQAPGEIVSDSSASIIGQDHLLLSLLNSCPAAIPFFISRGFDIFAVDWGVTHSSDVGMLEMGLLNETFRDAAKFTTRFHGTTTVRYLSDGDDTYPDTDELTENGRRIRAVGYLDELDLFRALLLNIRWFELKEWPNSDDSNKWSGHRGDAINILLCASGLGPKSLSGAGVRYPVDPEQVRKQYRKKEAKSVIADVIARASHLAEDLQQIATADDSHDAFQWAISSDYQNTFRITPFSCFGLCEVSANSIVYRFNISQKGPELRPEITTDRIAQLEEMINSAGCSELDYQRFFTDNPELLAGIDYRHVHPQLMLVSDSGDRHIPDFMLEPLDPALCDLLDLKLPYEELVARTRRERRPRFRAAVYEYIAQLNTYQRFFDEARNRRWISERYGLSGYKPKAVMVIGRRHHFKSDLERRELRSLYLHGRNIELWTYDDLLERARRLVSLRQTKR